MGRNYHSEQQAADFCRLFAFLNGLIIKLHKYYIWDFFTDFLRFAGIFGCLLNSKGLVNIVKKFNLTFLTNQQN